jgi:fucose permease
MKRKQIIVLLIIYLAFIALGLPDALLGSAWPLVMSDLTLPIGAIGFVTMFSYALTMLSTFLAPQVLHKVQTKNITFFSILMTGTALILMSRTTAFYQILLLAIPLGMGAGAIDLSLNHYTAVHYKPSHMSYLHAFYGLGVTIGPYIMSLTLRDRSWRLGYVYVGLLLFAIALSVLLSMPAWDEETEEQREEHHSKMSLQSVLSQKGVLLSLAIFLLYVHVETLLGVFIATFAFESKGVSYGDAALFTTMYFLALSVGRIVSGILTHKLHSNTLIWLGEAIMVLGAILLLIPGGTIYYYMSSVFLIGLGSGPVFPNMMSMNVHNFDKRTMSRVMSLQMMVGYLGFGLMTPLMIQIFQYTTVELYPYIVLVMTGLLVVVTTLFLRYKLHIKQER